MSATGTPTPNIGLRIPLGTDPASVDDINYNSNLIDTKLGAVGNDSVQDQIDDVQDQIDDVQDQIDELNSNLAKIEGSTISFWSTLSTQKYQGKYFAQVSGNFKGKTLTLTGAIVYNGTSSYNILSTTSITQTNDFCVNISTTSDSVGGTPLYVTFSVS